MNQLPVLPAVRTQFPVHPVAVPTVPIEEPGSSVHPLVSENTSGIKVIHLFLLPKSLLRTRLGFGCWAEAAFRFGTTVVEATVRGAVPVPPVEMSWVPWTVPVVTMFPRASTRARTASREDFSWRRSADWEEAPLMIVPTVPAVPVDSWSLAV